MAYYEGETLKDRITQGPIPVKDALTTACRVADGLANAHSHGVVHRDIKPGNIMVTKEGEIKIVDFGIAKLRGTTRFTQTGKTLGTLVYMSPEQTRGAEIDTRSDIFSLGVVLYELLTNRLPFDADHEEAVAFQIVNEAAPPLTDYRGDITPGLQRVMDKALQKDPNVRYQTITEFREDLDRVLNDVEPLAPEPPPPPNPYRKWIIGSGALLIGLAALLLIPQSRHAIKRLLGMGAPPPVQRLVVLPFENIGGDPVNQAFCDGMMETLTSKLTELERFHESLWVIPASDVRKEEITTAREARRVFGVNLVFTGSVQRLSDRLRLTLNLIEVEDRSPRQLNSVVIGRPVDELHRLQDDTVIEMAGLLNVELAPDTKTELAQGGTPVSRSFDSYVQGLGNLQRYDDGQKLDQAIRLFEKAIVQDPGYALAYSALGEAYWRKYRKTMDTQWVAPAIENAERAVALNDRPAAVHVSLGVVYRGTGRYEESIAKFERALRIDSLNVEAYRGLAGAYAELDRFDEAETTYQRAIELKPDFWGGYNELGNFYFDADRFEDALPQFHKITELTPDNTMGYNNMGVCYWYLDRVKEARTMFERSIKAKPNYLAYSNLGALYYIQGRYVDSAEVLEEALEFNEKSYSVWTNLGNAYYWIPGRRDEAIEVFRRCAEMAEENRKVDPRDESILIDLAGFYAITGEEALARTMIDEAQEIAPTDMHVMYQTGHAYEQMGEREKALGLIEKAVEAGYPVSEIENDPFMRELVADERYRQIVGGRGE
jgi:serine/threonine-protein kinase